MMILKDDQFVKHSWQNTDKNNAYIYRLLYDFIV